MKVFSIISVLLAFSCICEAQSLDENFKNGVPKSWVVLNLNGTDWEGVDSLGIDESPCLWADMSHSVGQGTSFLQTPLIDLEKLEEPYLQFQVALVNKNFVAPRFMLAVSPDGNWEKLASWGKSDEDSFITGRSNQGNDLLPKNVIWNEITWSLDSFKKHKKIRFSFNAVFTNGGWVLIDDVVVKDRKSVGNELPVAQFEVYPNPVTHQLNIQLKKGQSLNRFWVTNSQGKILLEPIPDAGNNSLVLNTAQFPPGVYFANVVLDSGEVITKKFLKSETF